MSGPPEEPTRRLPPTPPPERVREVEIAEGDPVVLDELRSLKRSVALLGVLSVLALGVALWALLQGDGEDDQGPRGASVQRVDGLEERVDQLEEEVEDAPTDTSVSRLRSRQEELQQQVEQLSEQAGGQDEATEAIEQLDGRVEEAEGRIDELEAQAEADAGSETGETP